MNNWIRATVTTVSTFILIGLVAVLFAYFAPYIMVLLGIGSFVLMITMLKWELDCKDTVEPEEDETPYDHTGDYQ